MIRLGILAFGYFFGYFEKIFGYFLAIFGQLSGYLASPPLELTDREREIQIKQGEKDKD